MSERSSALAQRSVWELGTRKVLPCSYRAKPTQSRSVGAQPLDRILICEIYRFLQLHKMETRKLCCSSLIA